MYKVHRQLKISAKYLNLQKRTIKYVQGQEPEPKIREYFYYIDHQGMLFLDDSRMKNFTSCLKEKKFLEFFFKRIRLNKTGSGLFPLSIEQQSPPSRWLSCSRDIIVHTQVHSVPLLIAQWDRKFDTTGERLLFILEN